MPELETNIFYYIRGRGHAGISHAAPARCKQQMPPWKASGSKKGIPVIGGKRRSMPHTFMTDDANIIAATPSEYLSPMFVKKHEGQQQFRLPGTILMIALTELFIHDTP